MTIAIATSECLKCKAKSIGDIPSLFFNILQSRDNKILAAEALLFMAANARAEFY